MLRETIRMIYYYILNIIYQPIYLLRKNSISIFSKCGRHVFITKTKIGKYCYIGTGSIISNTYIGNYCSIAAYSQIGGMEHPYWYGSTSPVLFNSVINLKRKTTIIEDDVWIGASVIIKQGVKIGRGAVIGSSSVVLSDVPPYSIYVGIPAKQLKMRFKEKTIKKLRKTEFWKFNPSKAKKLLNEIDFNES